MLDLGMIWGMITGPSLISFTTLSENKNENDNGTWHVTFDMWQVTYDMLSGVNILSNCQLPRAIPCQRSEKKGQRQKVDFFYETWKIIGQIDDFDRFLNNSCNFGVFLAKNQKYPKMTVLKKWKSERRKKKLKIEKLMSNIIYNILIVWIYDFVNCFVICNVLGHFLPF